MRLYEPEFHYFWSYDRMNSLFSLMLAGPGINKLEAEKHLQDVKKMYKIFYINCVPDEVRLYVKNRTTLNYYDTKKKKVIAQMKVE